MARKPHIVRTATPAGRGSATSHASQVNGNWLAAQAQEAIAKMRVHRSFDEARDPLMARQLADADKTEAQRREEQTGGGQSHKPNKVLAKSREQRPSNLAASGRLSEPGSILRAQYEAAMANRPRSCSVVRDQSLSPTRDPPELRAQRPYQGPSL